MRTTGIETDPILFFTRYTDLQVVLVMSFRQSSIWNETVVFLNTSPSMSLRVDWKTASIPLQADIKSSVWEEMVAVDTTTQRQDRLNCSDSASNIVVTKCYVGCTYRSEPGL